ncbi:MAG TPA: transcriptional repressor [Campylobacterales bacterium]|nr:transcriptional repressor [Campylobacterales bacterium]
MKNISRLKDSNLKVTPQRLEIVKILSTYGHMNINSLYEALREKFPTLSLATIYKNIHTMRDKSFLSEVKIPNQKNLYELKKEEHSHIVCSKCDDIIDIELDTSSFINQASSISNYKLDKSSIVLIGICPKCATI